jgi:hypothetical protein
MLASFSLCVITGSPLRETHEFDALSDLYFSVVDQFADVAIKIHFIEEEVSCKSVQAIFGGSQIITAENILYN